MMTSIPARFPSDASRTPLPRPDAPPETIGDPDTIDGQDRAHDRIRRLLSAVTEALLAEQPQVEFFSDHRPQRDRPSGAAWRGVETMCHVSALLVSRRAPDMFDDAVGRLLDVVDDATRPHGMARTGGDAPEPVAGIHRAIWSDAAGNRLELVIGVRLGVRAISAPFLPGSLQPLASTSPLSPLSAPTPPARPLY